MENLRVPVSYREWKPPVYYCRKATRPFVLDGNLRKEFWEDAPFTDDFLDIEGESMPKPHFRTRAKMLWDEENFYFGAILEGSEIWATLTERDCVIFNDNDFEIFIDPDSDTHQYFEFEMNALNTVWDLFLTKPYRDFGGHPLNGWDIHGLQTAVHIEGELNNPEAENSCWMVEVVMPFAALREMAEGAALPVPGDYYRVNFSRVQWDVEIENGAYVKKRNPETGAVLPERNWVWAPTGVINIHYPEHWGFVFFTENGEEYPIPETEQLKWELRKVYYLQQRHFDRHGHYASSLDEMEMDLPIYCCPDIQTTGRKFELSCAVSDGSSRVFLYEDGRTEVISAEKLEEELRRPPAEIRKQCSEEEYKYVDFLYRNQPLEDIGSCDPSFFLKAARHACETRVKMPWGKEIPEELFLNFVLPYRINNENPVFYQKTFFEELYPRVKDLSLRDAAIAVNYWCVEKAVYQSTNERTGSPFTVVNNAFGRCGEESTLAVSALRSVGIPARQVYAPRWSHCDDNHAWVEVYTGDDWHFLGACEPEEKLDTGWFCLPASKAMLVHTRAFSDQADGEVLVKTAKDRQEINALSRYADTAWLKVRVEDAQGRAVPGAEVAFEVVNYSEFFPVAQLVTDADGEVSFLTGKGDIILHVRKEGKFLTKLVDVRKETEATLVLSEEENGSMESSRFRFCPPQGSVEAETPEEEAVLLRGAERLAKAEACRKARESAFPDEAAENALEEELKLNPLKGTLIGARGNAAEVEKFLKNTREEERELAVRLLQTLEQKDLADCTAEMLRAHLERGMYFWKQREEDGAQLPAEVFDRWLLCPRIGLEFLTAFHQDVCRRFSKEDLLAFRKNPGKVMKWVQEQILLREKASAPKLSAAAGTTLRLGAGNEVSRTILAVAILRTCGIPSRLEVSDGCAAYWSDGSFHRMKEAGAEANGQIQLVRKAGSFCEYFKNITIGRLEEGRFRTLDFGNADWKEDVLTCAVVPGDYRIITTDRQPDESNLVHVDFCCVQEGETVRHEIAEREEHMGGAEVALSERELKAADGTTLSFHALLEQDGKQAVCWIRPGAEPTEHLLNEMIEHADHFNALENGPVFFIQEETERNNRTLQKVQGLVGNLRVYQDCRFELEQLYRGFGIEDEKLPLVVIADGKTGRYAFSGYQVGIGDMILKCLHY